MKRFIRKNLFVVCLVLALLLGGASRTWRNGRFHASANALHDVVTILTSSTNAGSLTLGTTLDVTGASTFNEVILTAGAVSLTSPTVTFSADGLGYIVLNSDANQTGVNPIGGFAGQVIVVVGGAGSNTMQFDDNGTTLSLGGNIVVTEGTGDALTLLCVTAPGNWTRIAEAQN